LSKICVRKCDSLFQICGFLFVESSAAKLGSKEKMIYRLFRAETLATVIASFMMTAVELRVLFSAGESIFSAKQETPDMIAAWTAASDFVNEREKLIENRKKLILKLKDMKMSF